MRRARYSAVNVIGARKPQFTGTNHLRSWKVMNCPDELLWVLLRPPIWIKALFAIARSHWDRRPLLLQVCKLPRLQGASLDVLPPPPLHCASVPWHIRSSGQNPGAIMSAECLHVRSELGDRSSRDVRPPPSGTNGEILGPRPYTDLAIEFDGYRPLVI